MEEVVQTETIWRDYIRVVFRHKVIIILCCLGMLSLVYVKQQMVTPYYTSSVKMFIFGMKLSEATYYTNVGMGGRTLADTTIQFVKSKGVIERVVEALKLYERPLDFDQMQNASDLKKYLINRQLEEMKQQLQEMSPEERKAFLFRRAVGYLSGSIDVSVLENTNVFVIKVRDNNASLAPKIANSVSRAYIIFDLEQKIAELKIKYGERHVEVIQLQNYIEDMIKNLDGRPLPDIEAFGPASVKVIGQAQSSNFEGGVDETAGLVLAFLIGIFGGTAMAFVVDYFSQTFKSPNDIEKHLNIPFLGSIPKGKSSCNIMMNSLNPGDDYAHYYQNISNNLDFSIRNKDIRSILISDADASGDTATVIANIGYCLTLSNKYRGVLIIDSDLRNSSLSKAFHIVDTPGLADILEGTMSFEDVVRDVGHNLHILSSGQYTDNAVALLDSAVMSDIINRAKDHYDVILIYSADLKNFSDAVKLSSHTDAFVLVINEGKVRRFIVKKAISPLEQKKIILLGAILNNRSMVIPKMIYQRI